MLFTEKGNLIYIILVSWLIQTTHVFLYLYIYTHIYKYTHKYVYMHSQNQELRMRCFIYSMRWHSSLLPTSKKLLKRIQPPSEGWKRARRCDMQCGSGKEHQKNASTQTPVLPRTIWTPIKNSDVNQDLKLPSLCFLVCLGRARNCFYHTKLFSPHHDFTFCFL